MVIDHEKSNSKVKQYYNRKDRNDNNRNKTSGNGWFYDY